MTTVLQSTTHKRGGTFGRAGTFPVPPGTWTVAAQVRTATGTLVADLDCTADVLADLDAAGNTVALAITSPDDTAAWPVKTLVCDIRFADAGGNVLATTTFLIIVEQEVTTP